MRLFVLLLSLGLTSAWGQSNLDFANLREDVRGLSQRVGELSLRVEQLERENAQLRQQAESGQRGFATVVQLNEAVATMNQALKASTATSRAEVLDTVSRQMEKLAKQTDAALQALAKNQATRPVVQTTFSEDYAKEGISYTVQKGDTLAVIARKTGAKMADLINANKISDPSKIVPGQTLFIPGGK